MKQNLAAYTGEIALVLFLIGSISVTSHAQQAESHRQAAAAYRQAASQSSGTRKECYLQWANYEDCQAARFGSGGPASCSQPTCSLADSGGQSTDSSNQGVSATPTVINPFPSIEDSFNSLRNTILNIMNNSRKTNPYEDIERKEENEAKEAIESINNARARSNRDPEAESEEDERAKERERLYKEQRARERSAASVQTSDVCGWKGLQWFGDRDTVPTLDQLRAANGGKNAVLSGDGAMILKIRTITKDGRITGDISGLPVTGTINAKRQIWLAGGDKESTYYEVWGQFSEDGNVITGKWKTEGYKVDISKPSRGIFALEAECKK
jgi:hypothetical protein